VVVYNFEVADDHDYFVGESGLLVHNTVCDLELKYKPGWTPNQIAAADTKVAALNDADTVVTDVQRSGTSASRVYQASGGTIPPGSDVDHIIDLQLGGADEVSNMSPLDLSVNRSLGAQIAQQIADLPNGTVIRYLTIGW
jgi:filamentous hemagglutinin